jgi:hypothetical protein
VSLEHFASLDKASKQAVGVTSAILFLMLLGGYAEWKKGKKMAKAMAAVDPTKKILEEKIKNLTKEQLAREERKELLLAIKDAPIDMAQGNTKKTKRL